MAGIKVVEKNITAFLLFFLPIFASTNSSTERIFINNDIKEA